MNGTDIAAVSVTSSFLAISFAHVLKEFISSLRIGYEQVTTVERERSAEVKNTLSGKIYRLLLYHVGINNLTLLVLLGAVCGIISSITTNHMSTVCFVVGALTSVVSGFLAMYVCKRTSSKLVTLSHKGLREVYKRCLGNSSAIVVLSLDLNLVALFVLTLVFAGNEESSSEDVLSVLKMLSFFAFGTLFVTLFSRLSGGLFTNSCSILLECNLEDRDEHKTLFENLNNYLQNIYELVLEVLAMVSTLFCTFFMVMGQYTVDDKLFGSSFGFLNFPMVLMAFSMFVSVVFVTLFSFMKNNTLKKVKNSYTYSTVCSLVVIFAVLPLFHAYFLPESVKDVKYGRFTNYLLVTLGLVCGMFIAISNQYFLSSYNAPGRSVTLSVVTSLTGGIVNSLSYAKVLCLVPTALVCLNLFLCLVFSDFYGLIFVSCGFMCSTTVVMTGSVFYSLIFTSSHLAEYSEDSEDVIDMFKSLKSSWHTINTITRPFLGTWCVLMGLVLLSHLSKKLEVKNYSYLNPYVLISLLLGALFPVFESGLVLRISSSIANRRLKKSSYSGLMDNLYVDYKRKDPRNDDDSDSDSDDFDPTKMARDYANKLMGMFKQKKNGSADTRNSDEGRRNGDKNARKHNNDQNNQENFDNSQDSEFNRDSSQYDNYNLVNYEKEKSNDQNDQEKSENPDVVIEVESEREENYRKFGGAFKACLLKEAGVKEDLLLNAPVTCSSARSTHEHYLVDHYYNNIDNTNQNRARYQPASTTQQNTEDSELKNEEEFENERSYSNDYRHHSRDYRILKNADNHYKMFHPKYHIKHFNLRKRSTVASGNLEELQTLIPLGKNDRREDEDDLTLAYEEEQALYASNNDETKVEEQLDQEENQEQADQNNKENTDSQSDREESKKPENQNDQNNQKNNENQEKQENKQNKDKLKSEKEKLKSLLEKLKHKSDNKTNNSQNNEHNKHKNNKDNEKDKNNKNKGNKEENQENKQFGDSLDQVVRRSQNLEDLGIGNVELLYDRSSSCGSTYRESETTSLLKPVHTHQVHTMEPPSDDHEFNNLNNNNESSLLEPQTSTESKPKTKTKTKSKTKSKSRSGSSDNLLKSVDQSEGSEGMLQDPNTSSELKPKKKKKKKRPSDGSNYSDGSREDNAEKKEGTENKESKTKKEHKDKSKDKEKEKDKDKSSGEPKPKKKKSAKKAKEEEGSQETAKDKTESTTAKTSLSSDSSGDGFDEFKTSLVEKAFALREQRKASLVLSQETQEGRPDSDEYREKENLFNKEENKKLKSEKGEKEKEKEDNEPPFTINVQQALLPPDVGISNQPRRPTPKSIQLPDFKDLEANRPDSGEVQPQNSLIGVAKRSAYQNTLLSLMLSLIPLLVALGFPYLVGVVLGKNAVLVAVLFSSISSSILVQVLTFCSMSWEATLHFVRVKKMENKLGNRSSVVNEIDVENGHTCRKIGKIASSSVGPVMNALILTLPLVCLFGTEIFDKFSNNHGFPQWTDYES